MWFLKISCVVYKAKNTIGSFEMPIKIEIKKTVQLYLCCCFLYFFNEVLLRYSINFYTL